MIKLIPAEVESWDGSIIRVHIPGYTDGAEMGMRAEILFPLADRPGYTGYRILKGDPIWVMFNNDDPNQPIVMGFRNKNTGENKDTRRFIHKHFEAHADENMLMTSKSYRNEAQSTYDVISQAITIQGNTITLNGAVNIAGAVSVSGGASISGGANIDGDCSVSGNLHARSVTDDDGDGGA